MKLKSIAELLDGTLSGDEDIEISGVAKIEEAKQGDITFISNSKYRKYLSSTKASAVIIDDKVGEVDFPHIKVDDAYVGFVFLLKAFSPQPHNYIRGISENAHIENSAQIGESVAIAPHVYIGPDVVIGKETIIYPGVVLLKNVRIGARCVLYPNVSIREDCIVGDRVILHNGVVVGSDGFGFAPRGEKYLKIPQLGNVIVENDVEIGANTTIDRATLGSTIIRAGSKLDNLVQIAHNVHVGANTVIASQTGIAGSSEVGKHVTIGGQVGITGHIKVGDHAMIAAQSGITKDIPEKTVMFGTPALPLTQRKRIDVSLRHLPEMVKRLKQLEKELSVLKQRYESDNAGSEDDQETEND